MATGDATGEIRPQAEVEPRLRELILYIADKCEYDPRFGATKLNKILFFADFIAYERFGNAITGARYQKLKHGPAPRLLPRVRQQLLDADDVIEKPVKIYDYNQHRLIARREPNLDRFQAREIAVIDQVIDLLREMTAEEASEFSHRFRGWQLAEIGEDIPYSTVYLADGPPELSEDEVAEARDLARQIG